MDCSRGGGPRRTEAAAAGWVWPFRLIAPWVGVQWSGTARAPGDGRWRAGARTGRMASLAQPAHRDQGMTPIMHRLPSPRLALPLLMLLTGWSEAADVPSPESHLGYRPGADFHLARWQTVVDYFEKVDAASDRVVVRELGKSTEGRPYIVATVASPETIDEARRLQGVAAAPGRPSDRPARRPGGREQGRRPDHLLDPLDRDGLHPDGDGAAPRPGHRRRPGDPGDPRRTRSCSWCPRPTPTAWRRSRLVRADEGEALGRGRDARALPQVCRARHEPRLVHAQPEGDAAPDPAALPRVVPDAHLRRPPDGLEGGEAVRPAVLRPDQPEPRPEDPPVDRHDRGPHGGRPRPARASGGS